MQFVALNVGANDPVREVAYQAVKVDAEFVVGKDFDAVCARALGVERMPTAVVLDGQRHIRYRGRIDGQYRLGGARPDAGRDDLKLAIDDVLAGREVAMPETAVDGCRITVPELPPAAEAVTFSRHIAPLLQKHCQDCHHDDGNAPFPEPLRSRPAPPRGG